MNHLFRSLLPSTLLFVLLFGSVRNGLALPAATYTVTTTADSGPGSLRQAITDANANPDLDTITFAIGTPGSQQSIQPVTVLPSITNPVFVNGWSQGGAGYSGAPLIEINGAVSGSYGLRITAGNSTVRGLAINGFSSGVVLLTAGGNWVYANYIGTNQAGDTAVANTTGISINADSSSNIIGTNGDGIDDALEGNLISGNGDWGILFSSATNNIVAGNKIGTDATGTAAIPNGTNSSSRAGVYLGGTGNRLGTNNDGLSDTLERNLISGNNGCGIAHNIQSNPAGTSNLIAGNYVGTDISGMAALPNTGSGLCSFVGPNYNTIIRGNVISGNDGGGISISGLNQGVIRGNFIGVGADGMTALGNGSLAYNGSPYGIFLSGSDNQIGGVSAGEANIIANMTAGAAFRADGIALGSTALRNVIRGNQVYNNKDMGLDLNNDNIPNPNDEGDGDTGANNLQNFPIIDFAQSYANGETVITGTLNSQTSTAYTLDFYASTAADDSGYGEGEFYLGADQVTTDASGWVTFTITLNGVSIPGGQFVTATATDPDGNTSEFSLALGPVSGIQDVPINGLTAQVNPPVYVNTPATFVASVSAGTNVTYAWNFGDSGLGSGAVVAHIYTTPGTYTATLSASNSSSNAITETLVTVSEPANINGFAWLDRDADGFFGMGEIIYNLGQYFIITATLQGPPNTVLNAPLLNGSYQIFTPQAGVYLVEATNTVSCPIITHCISTPNPIPVAMGEDGGTEINFGVVPVNFVPQPDDDGYIYGRAWIDSNGDGHPDSTETPLNGYTVRLLDADGNQINTITTGANWGYGSYGFRISNPGLYRVQMDAPGGIFPASRTVEVYVSDMRAVNAQLPFLAGGSIGGQVTNSSGTGMGNVVLTLQPGNLQTMTTADGSYNFSGLAEGSYTLQITPSTNYVTPDGLTQRLVPVTLNSGTVENWSLWRKGQLTVRATQVNNGVVLPVGNMFFEVLQNGSVVNFAITGMDGLAVIDGLTPGTYTVRPLEVAILPGSLVNPVERTAIITYDSAATLSFSFSLARSVNLYCQLPGSPPTGFNCLFEIRNSNGSLIESGSLTAANPATTLWNLNPATLEVRLIPDPSVPGQDSWPTHSQIVVLDDSTHANVYYPFNPTASQTISGYAFWDRCTPLGSRANVSTCNETGAASNNALTVTLKTPAGAIIATTQTSNGPGYNTGYYAFPNLPIGSYLVAIALPTGCTPTTAIEYGLTLDGITAPDQFSFGYQLNTNRSLSGRVYYDLNTNGQFDPDWDDVHPGILVTITTPTGQTVATRTTASDGSFTVDPITSGEYRVTIAPDGETYTQVASVPASGAIPTVNFALFAPDSLPRVLLFVDSDRDGVADADEQRLSNVNVSLVDQPCGQTGALLETKPSLSDGTIIFAAPPAGNTPLCASIASGLPGGLMPASNKGILVPRTSGQIIALPVQTTSVLLVRFYWDADGDAMMDANEPALGGGSVTLNGSTYAIPFNGPYFTNVFLLPGSYSLGVTSPYGYQPGVSIPLTVLINSDASQTINIPFRAQSGISGLITGASAAQVGGLLVELENVGNGQIWQTNASSLGRNNPRAGRFTFANLPVGTYRLRIPTPPPGYAITSDPLITLSPNASHTENIALVPVGHVAGQVFIDINGDGVRQGDEGGTNAFAVQLVGMGGQVLQNVTPSPNGSFIVENLTANTPYVLQVLFPNSSWFTTVSPGVFTIGAQTVDVVLGVNYAFPSGSAQSGITGNAIYLLDGVEIPIANARVVFESSNGVPLGEQQTGANGEFLFTTSLTSGRARIVDVPGFENSAWYGWYKGDRYCGQCVLIGIFVVNVENIILIPTPPLLNAAISSEQPTAIADVAWSAFRDDNGNGLRDAGEPGLPGVTLASGTLNSQNNASGLGLLPLPDGLHTLSITAPAGYLVIGSTERLLSTQGTDVTLPPIPLRPTGITLVTAFLDLDGDGSQGIGEPGLGGVNVTLTGPTTTNGVTALDGRVMFNALSDGDYILSFTAPVGFGTPAQTSLSVSDGGVISVLLYPVGVVTALVYEDWDGDGLRAENEIQFRWPFTLTLQTGTNILETVTAAGLGTFMGISPNSYSLGSPDEAIAGTSITLPANGGTGAGLAVATPDVVRGVLWLDQNGDGLRQPWEAPLAGVSVTLDGGATIITDHDGKYLFTEVTTGNHILNINLPSGLTATIPAFSTTSGRGAAVGVAVTATISPNDNQIFLPLVTK